MKYNPNIHHPKSIRLHGYDYSQNGAYFVTICVQNRENRFGRIEDGRMFLNDVGEMIDKYWNQLKQKYFYVTLDEYVIMPNHIHGIIVINDMVGAGLVPAQNNSGKRATTRVAPTIGNIVGAFKSLTTHEYINGVKNKNWQPFSSRIWQRNYYEHIIRKDEDLDRIREYINLNPKNWEKDELFFPRMSYS